MSNLPSTLFSKVEEIINESKRDSRNLPIINLSIGDPDRPTPPNIVNVLCQKAQEPKHHHYSPGLGLSELRAAVAEWYWDKHRVKLDIDTEIIHLVGIKEGISFAPMAFIEKESDIVIAPNPGWTGYTAGTALAGGSVYHLPLLKDNDFLPDVTKIPKAILARAKLLFLNYPNNPTGAVATKDFFKEIVAFAQNTNIVVCHDAAYSSITYDDYIAPSFLEVEGAKAVGVEFFSLSKMFNMTGWRIGFVVGNQVIAKSIQAIRLEMNSGVFLPIQYAAIEALRYSRQSILDNVKVYQRRRDVLVKRLTELGCEFNVPRGAFYVWVKIPDIYSSLEFTMKLAKAAKVITVPGIAFGEYGEGYIRLALTADEDKIEEACDRIQRLKLF